MSSTKGLSIKLGTKKITTLPTASQYKKFQPMYETNLDIHRWVRVDAPKFDGNLDINFFFLNKMGDFFDFYGMTDIYCVHLAKPKLMDHGKLYWYFFQLSLWILKPSSNHTLIWDETKVERKICANFSQRQSNGINCLTWDKPPLMSMNACLALKNQHFDVTFKRIRGSLTLDFLMVLN